MALPHGHLGRDGVVGLSCFEHQRRDACGQFGRGEAFPYAVAEAFAGEQVEFAVQPGEALAVVGDVVAAEVVELGEEGDDPVEGAGDGVGAAFDAPLQLLGVALEAVVALGPAGMVLALVAAVAGVGADLGAQPGDVAVVGGGGALFLVALGVDVSGLAAQGGGEVAA